ncbi:DUF257 family protein [Thermococcus barophilus]|uniref:KaiC-like domain-containing protein n=1 Tax=Thermococcus barophilus (strain DSM 11836 / MP) TaxID=391623 RepID=F0LH61_THEBM|nr:DUF257 family protein [Thermococcus barophilus]ADT83023.1 hypothetical protein TERMP_00045 [Thermococcus barophilus MP]
MTDGRALIEYLGSIKFGESVLVEYSPEAPIPIIFRETIEFLLKKYNVLILDIFDTLHMIKEPLKIMGWDAEKLDKIDVVKAGGIINTGNIVKRIDISKDPAVYTLEFAEFMREYYATHRPTVLIALGIDKLIRLYTNEVTSFEIHIAGVMKKFLGERSRLSLYFANMALVPKETLYEWEEIVTRVFEITLKGKMKFVIKVKKSPNIEDHEKEFVISADELPLVKA